MNTLKSLSLLAVCVVAGVVLFTLKGDLVRSFTWNEINNAMNKGSKLGAKNVYQGQSFTFNLAQEGAEAGWKIVANPDNLSCSVQTNREASGIPGAVTIFECTSNKAGEVSIEMEDVSGHNVKLYFDVQPKVGATGMVMNF